MRRTYRYIDGELVLVKVDGKWVIDEPTEDKGPMVFPDLPGYQSPVSGKWIDGRKARRDDLARTNSRPWEGLEQEKKEAAKHAAERERRDDQLAEKMAHRAWAEAPERVRRMFRSK